MKRTALFFIGFLLSFFSYSQSCTNGFFQVYVPTGGSVSTFGKYNPITDTYQNNVLTYQGNPIVFKLNAVGYNSLDGFIYGIATSAGNGIVAGTLVKINPNSNVLTTVSTPSNWSLTTAKSFYVGDVTTSGIYYCTAGGTMYIYNITTNTLTISSTTFGGADWAYIPSKNKFYGINGNKLYAFDPTNNSLGAAIILSPTTGSAFNINSESGSWGAAWTAADGFLYAANNNTGRMYRIDLTANTARFLSNAQATGTNDGTSCPTAASPFIPNLVTRKRTSTPVVAPNGMATYTLEVVNYGADAASNVSLIDSLPVGFSLVAVTNVVKTGTASGPSNPTNSGSASVLKWGTYTIPGDDTVAITFTVTASNTIGTYNNCGTSTTTTTGAAVTAYDCRGLSDENVRVAYPNLVVTKSTTTPLVANGQSANYHIKVKNTGSTASNVVVKDMGLPTGFVYTGSATYTQGGVTGAAVNIGSTTAPEFGYFSLAYNDSIKISFQVLVGNTNCGTQHNSATASSLSTGTTVVDYDGFTHGEEDVTVQDNIAPTVVCRNDTTLNANALGCKGIVNGLGITASDNCGIQSIMWEMTGATTLMGTADVSGQTFNTGTTTVTYTVKDNGGNISTCSFNVMVTSALQASSSTLPISGCNMKNGSLTINATAGVPSYLYKLEGGIYDTSNTFNNLLSQKYTFTVQDNLGCEVSGTDSVGSNCTITFPVQWVNFSATEKQGYVALQWSTASETQNSHFEVEASSDRNIFESIGAVNGAINSNSLQQYSFRHTNPSSGMNYYRIKQVDINGAFTYSNIEAVRVTAAANEINVYPNPSNDGIFHLALQGTSLSKSTNWTVQIVDLSGKIVWENAYTGNDIITIDAQILDAGIYILMAGDGRGETEKMKIQISK